MRAVLVALLAVLGDHEHRQVRMGLAYGAKTLVAERGRRPELLWALVI